MKQKNTPFRPSKNNKSATPKVSPVSPPYARAGERHSRARRPATPPPGWQEVYFEELAANGGQMTAAAEVAQVSLRTVQRLRGSDAAFAREECLSMEMARDILESEVRRRALDGVERVRYNKDGVVISRDREHSDFLLIRLLERIETGSWRQRQQIETGPPGAFNTAADRKAELERARREIAETSDQLPEGWRPPPPGSGA